MGKKKNDTIAEEIEAIQREARESFDFRARLAESNNRRRTVTIYTDAAAGEELGYAADEIISGIKTGTRIRKGLIGRLDALEAEGSALLKHFSTLEEAGVEIPDVDSERVKEINSETKKLRTQIAALKKRLKSTSFEFSLISLPDIAKRDARRKSRQELGIKGKGIPESRLEEFQLEFTAQIIAASVERWVDHKTGDTYSGLSVQQSRDLRDWLPEGQYGRLDHACTELSFEAAIANASTDDPDF